MHSGTKEGDDRLAAAFASSGAGITVTGHGCHHRMLFIEMIAFPAPGPCGVPAACPMEEAEPVLGGYSRTTRDGE
jgi:hypothetical protein